MTHSRSKLFLEFWEDEVGVLKRDDLSLLPLLIEARGRPGMPVSSSELRLEGGESGLLCRQDLSPPSSGETRRYN